MLRSVVVGFADKKEWATEIINELWSEATQAKRSRLFPEDFLIYWETNNRMAARALGLLNMSYQPHAMRHAGPSWDVYEGKIDVLGAQQRGRWLALESCRRYSRPAMLRRQIPKIQLAQRNAAMALLPFLAATARSV